MKGSLITVIVALLVMIEDQVSPMVAQNKHHRAARSPQGGGGGGGAGGWIGGGVGIGAGAWAGAGAGAGPGGNATNGFGFGYIPQMGGGRIGFPGEEYARAWEKYANFGKYGKR